MYEMRHNIRTVDLPTLEDLQEFLRAHGAQWTGYGPIQLEVCLDAHDTLFRMAMAVRVRNDPTLSFQERERSQTILASPGRISFSEREQILVPLLAWLNAYDRRCAAVVRGHLAGETDVPWRGHRSTEQLVKVLTIVKDLQDAQDDALPDEQPDRVRKARPRRQRVAED